MLNPAIDRLELIGRLRLAVGAAMAVISYSFDHENPKGPIRLQGRLLMPPDRAYRHMRTALEAMGFTPFLGEVPDKPNQYELAIFPGVVPKQKSDPKVNLWLFIATVASVIFTGGATSTGFDWASGLMFAGTLLSILVVHEAGHYLVGRWRGEPVSLPYFIPLPLFSIMGTLGAVIVQREPFEDRRRMLEIGIAGPLAGFIVAVPLYILGMALSEIKPVPTDGNFFTMGDSLLTMTIGQLMFGYIDPASGRDVFAHPIAFGAWIGLLITGINLIPAGQLDGGHIAAALLGARAKYVSWACIIALFALSFISETWLVWGVLLFIFGRSHPAPLNQATKLDVAHYALAIAGLLVFVLVFVARPIY